MIRPESDLARRVRERANAAVDWSVESRVRVSTTPKPRTKNLADGLPRQQAPQPVGAVGRLKPTPHEAAILRRAARPGSFVLVTMREDKPPRYVYGDDGSLILSESGGPLDQAQFERLAKFLVPEANDCLFENGPPQRWNVRRVIGGDDR